MFATLVGTDSGNEAHRMLFDRLCAIAIERGYVPPVDTVRVQPDGSLRGWSLEQRGPQGREADFYLAVTAPRVPGISPIFPVVKTIEGPLFAVVVLAAAFVVSRQDRRDVAEFKDPDSVASQFQQFLAGLQIPR